MAIDFSTLTEANFNGTALTEINYNGASVWQQQTQTQSVGKKIRFQQPLGNLTWAAKSLVVPWNWVNYAWAYLLSNTYGDSGVFSVNGFWFVCDKTTKELTVVPPYLNPLFVSSNFGNITYDSWESKTYSDSLSYPTMGLHTSEELIGNTSLTYPQQYLYSSKIYFSLAWTEHNLNDSQTASVLPIERTGTKIATYAGNGVWNGSGYHIFRINSSISGGWGQPSIEAWQYKVTSLNNNFFGTQILITIAKTAQQPTTYDESDSVVQVRPSYVQNAIETIDLHLKFQYDIENQLGRAGATSATDATIPPWTPITPLSVWNNAWANTSGNKWELYE